MTLTRLYDYYGMNFIDRWKNKEIKRWYHSDNLDDVYTILDCANNDIIFDKKSGSSYSFSPFLLQSYIICLDDSIVIEENKDSLLFSVEKSGEHPQGYKFIMMKKDYNLVMDKINKKGIKSQGDNILFRTHTYNSLFLVSSLFSYPLLKNIDYFIPPKRNKKSRKNIKSLLDRISVLEPQPSLVNV